MNKFETNEFGVIVWNETDPVDERLKVLDAEVANESNPESVREGTKDATVHIQDVHAQLLDAQAIALTMFGLNWEAHLYTIYQLLRDEEKANP